MFFHLTDELCFLIIKAMEDSNNFYVFDSSNCQLVLAENTDEANPDFYPLPFWTSKSGFKLRMKFIESLPDSPMRTKLQIISHSGRGFFKEFKQIINDNSNLKTKWYFFKNVEMRKKIHSWYIDIVNSLSENNSECISLHELLYSDFVFKEYSFSNENLTVFIKKCLDDEFKTIPNDLVYLFDKLYNFQYNNNKFGFICNSPFDDLIGCLFFEIDENSNKKIAMLDCFFVQSDYQGLGLGTELLSLVSSKLKSCNIDWIVIPNFFLTEKVIHILQKKTYKKNCFGYYKKLTED